MKLYRAIALPNRASKNHNAAGQAFRIKTPPRFFAANNPARHPHEALAAQTLYQGIVTVLKRRGFLQNIPGVTTGRIIAVDHQYFLALLVSGAKLMGGVFRCPGEESLGDTVGIKIYDKAHALFKSIEAEVMAEAAPILIQQNIAGLLWNPALGLQPCFQVLSPNEDELHSVILSVALGNGLSREEGLLRCSDISALLYHQILPPTFSREAETHFTAQLQTMFSPNCVVEGHSIFEHQLPRLINIFFPIDIYLNFFGRYRENFQPAAQQLWTAFNESLVASSTPYLAMGYPPFAFQIGALSPTPVHRGSSLHGLVFQIYYRFATDLREITPKEVMPPLLDFVKRMSRG